MRSEAPDKDMIYGLRPVQEALDAGKEINKVLVQRGLQGDLGHDLLKALRAQKVPVQSVPVEKLNRITRKNHQGFIAFVAPVTYYRLDQLLPSIWEAGETPLFMILDRVTDTRNLGAIARTAECAGAHALIIPEREAAQVTSDAVRTSAGALLRLPVCREQNLRKTIDYLQQSGIQIVACTEKTTDLIYEPDLTKPTAIVMGSEEDGIANDLLQRADHLASIPMVGSIGSLNVSVASGILLYELMRQRRS